ncbi:hypothetical protein C0993_007807 [Termitomyces sp. T159_Od127]|nr:hypothetical protein C0993_007807 [Termitomyces sp. T159_Od127]
MSDVLSEQYLQECFHNYLVSSLTWARAERLLDADILSSAESDLMTKGPALCMYFAALRSTTNPPSVSLRSEESGLPIDLSLDNCPPAFTGILCVWAQNVPAIQSLIPEHQHDLARVICGLKPLSQPAQPVVVKIAEALCKVTAEINQRRSFQDRFASDLQAVFDSGTASGSPNCRRASFVASTWYDPSPPPSLPMTPVTTATRSPGPLSPTVILGATMSNILSEQHLQDWFHSYLQSSLTQAKAERILGVDILSSAESDLMTTG